ncbi:MAG: RNase P subunit p30 family protein [Candidatus Hodarchaeales archaeon]
MKRRFVDAAIQFSQEDHFKDICRMAATLGYSGICIENLKSQNAIDRHADAKSIKIWSRKTLRGSIGKVKNALGHERRKHHLISILAEEQDLAKWAARDQRVDCILVPLSSIDKVIDAPFVKLAATHRKALEIHLHDILKAIESRRVGLLRNLHKALAKVRQRSCQILMGSGTSKSVHMRAPRDMAALLETVGLNYEDTLETIANVPLTILERTTSQTKEEIEFP